MIQISLSDNEKADFAKQAMKRFEENKALMTFSLNNPKDGDLFAVRWGLLDNCVLVFTIGDEPIIYTP